MKRSRLPSSSEDSDNGREQKRGKNRKERKKAEVPRERQRGTRGKRLIWTHKEMSAGHSTSWSQHSKSQHRRNSWSRSEDRKPSEVFRTDLITAMKLHDSYQLNPEDYYILADPWRQEWEKGVQVPVSPESIPWPVVRCVAEKEKMIMFTRPKKFIRSSGSEPVELGYVDIRTLAEGTCRYDLNETDVAWLELINEELQMMGMQGVDELTMERVMEELERRCYDNMNHAIETEEGLGIEYDEDVVCDVCQSPDGEDGNEMVFCDKCNICVHQACYGILKVPEGSWLCRTCALGVLPKCLLCPKKGGAMKPTRSGTKWVHVSCALWIPEVSIGNPEKMEPITNVSHIPSSRWALLCRLCKEKTGACIQCSAKNCRTAFHVTCAFQRNLKMKTILTETDEVKFKSFCLKHSGREEAGKLDAEVGSGEEEEEDGGEPRKMEAERSPARGPEPAVLSANQQEAQMVNLRKQKLQQLEDEFYKFVTANEVAQYLRLPEEVVDFIYQFWKLKRKANFNKPLITPKKDEEDNLAKREQDVLFRRLQLFTHLRQDLERVRNLTYMVTRREKMKRSVCRVQEQILHHHVRLLEEERLSGIPSSIHLEDALFFSDLTSEASKPEPLKFPSEHPGHETGRPCPGKGSHRRERGGASQENCRSGLLKLPNSSTECGGLADNNSDSGGTSRKVGERAPDTERLKPFPRLPHLREKRNGTVVGEYKKRDDGHRHEENGHELRERASSRPGHKPARPTEDLMLKQMENKRAPPPPPLTQPAARNPVRRPSGDAVPKCNGSLKKANCNQAVIVSVPNTPTSPMKNWGGFKIPKKGERPQQTEGQEAPHGKLPSEDRAVHRISPKARSKARLKTEVENDGYAPDAELSDSEVEAKEKKCRPKRLNAGTPINRRYGTDIIRRSILAS
ncbi:protein Jade-1 isoform X2 [Lepisosteus oculatus]|uniref:protein Jade-1 isoform X2 n=1 Tax=Lepisosteus oculatus TaxID=7918 RepID=UPI0035F52F8C